MGRGPGADGPPCFFFGGDTVDPNMSERISMYFHVFPAWQFDDVLLTIDRFTAVCRLFVGIRV